MSRKLSHQPGHTVGAKLRAERLAKRYTQHQLAQPEFSVSYISAIERDQIQPSLRALATLARRLGLTSADLLPASGQLSSRTAQARRMAEAGEERNLQVLEAWLYLHQGQTERALAVLHALPTLKGTLGVEALARYLLGRAYLANGSLQESEQALAEAAHLARESGDPLYPCILSEQNMLYTRLHMPEQANQTRHESRLWLEQESTSPDSAFFRAQLLVSLGRSASYFEQFDQAQQMFQQALAALTLQKAPFSIAEDYTPSHQMEATSLLTDILKYRQILADFQQRLPGLRSEIQHALGRVLLKNKPDEAYAALLEVAQEAEARHDALTQASANVHLAACLIARGEGEQAAEQLRKALELTAVFSPTIIEADALLLQGELSYAQQEYESGDRFFESGLSMLEGLGREEELVERLAHYAHLLEERGQLHKAIIYWKRAYENHQKHV